MPFKLTVDLPSLGEQEIYIHGLGSFANGTHEISDELAENFSTVNTRSMLDYDNLNEEGVAPYVTTSLDLETTVSSMHGVTLERTNIGTPVDTPDTGDTTVPARTGTSESGGDS